jgi:hypothetical protein
MSIDFHAFSLYNGKDNSIAGELAEIFLMSPSRLRGQWNCRPGT